jgi:hypothetical protein
MLKKEPRRPARAAMVKKKGSWKAHCVRLGLLRPSSEIIPVVLKLCPL